MKRQVIRTNWKNGKAPVVVYQDHGPSAARSREPGLLDTAPHQGREAEKGGKVKRLGPIGRSGGRSGS